MPIRSHHLAGWLLTVGPQPFSAKNLERAPFLHPAGDSVDGWTSYDYLTDKPIPRVDDSAAPPPYTHELVFRWGRTSFLVLSTNYDTVKYFIRLELRHLLGGALRRSAVKVHSLVLYMMDPKETVADDNQPSGLTNLETAEAFRTRYCLSYVAARTDAFGESLQVVTFSGARVSEASLFEESSPLMRYYSCSLSRDGEDIIKLGRDGFVSFDIPRGVPKQRGRLREVNAILRQLVDLGMVT